jgi:hypothetical protein
MTDVEREIASLRAECGCALGSAFLTASFAVYPVIWLVELRHVLAPWPSIALAPLFFVAAALAGKALGIARARYRLHRLLRRTGPCSTPA